MRTSLLVIILLSFLCHSGIQAQNVFVNKERVIQELEKRGLEYDEVSEALAAKGIDLRFLDKTNVTPEEVKVIQEVILEMEKEKLKKDSENEVLGDDEDDVLDEEMEKDSLEMELIEEDDEADDEEEGEILIYGQNLYKDEVLELQASSEEVKAPDSYILGPGDDLIVSIWGKSQLEKSFRIGADGYVKILEGKRRVFLKGKTLGFARQRLEEEYDQYYPFTAGDFDVSINYSRTIRVGIYGEVESVPGTYAIPAFNSAFNALAAVGGTNEIGSVRNIQLRKPGQPSVRMDIYEFMKDPGIASDYYMEENDVILVPIADKIITIEGAVRRPMKYELIAKEGVKELLSFCGGFAENAFQKKIQVHRFVDDDRKIIDLDWRKYADSGRNFELLHGDLIIVEEIETEYKNFVEIVGEVSKPGVFQREKGMRVGDLVRKAGITDESNTTTVFLTRNNNDGTFAYEKLQLRDILNNPNSPQNLLLKNKDKLEIWARDRFNDDIDFAIDGAVRYPGKFPYDTGNSIRVRDAILLAGGLRRDASNYAIIHRNDPLNPKIKYYKTIHNLEEIFNDASLETNFILDPFDSLVIESKNTFLEESFVRIEGAVNTPGEYHYGQDMTIKDLMTLAGGFKLAASTNNIEISRVIIKNNEPTRTVVANLEMDREFNVIRGGNQQGGNYRLEPFDNIAVRYIKEFQLQKRVFLEGEVAYPGPYAISKENEKILSILERAGGLTDEAFPAGATLKRDEQQYGYVVIKLEEILQNPDSEFNFYVKNGDLISVPKIKEFVTIKGATRAYEVVGGQQINEGNEIHVPYHKNKDAMFYIDEYAGGLHESADRSKIFVEHANGEIKRPSQGFLRKRVPKVYQGSVITVGFKSLEQNEEEKKSDVDWTKVLGDSVAQAMSILTLILLIGRLD